MTPPFKERAVVRSLKDGKPGKVSATYREVETDPWMVLVRWHGHGRVETWHNADTLELVAEPEEEPMQVDDVKDMIGKNLAGLRAELGLTQTEFATRIGLKRDFLATLETGRTNMTVSTLIQICERLDIDANRIIKTK